MDRHVLLIFVLFFLSAGDSFAQKTRSPAQNDNFFGSVRLVVATDLNDRKDASGKLITDTLSLDSDVYNTKGELTERLYYSALAGHKLAFNTRYVYLSKFNKSGNKTETAMYKNYKMAVYKYDSKGNMTTLESYLPEGNLNYKNTYLYDAKGNQVVENDYNSKDSLISVLKNIFDNKGNLIQVNRYMPNGLHNNIMYFKYAGFDKKGNWTKRILSGDGKLAGRSSAIRTERKIIYY